MTDVADSPTFSVFSRVRSTSRWSSARTRRPVSGPSSRSTRRRSAPPSAAPASIRTRREADAVRDVLNLSQGDGLQGSPRRARPRRRQGRDHRRPAPDKTEALLRAYGRFVQSLGGRYLTACDVGTYSEDMDIVARECDFVTGRTVEHGGAGDSSVLTAFGVFQGMRAAAEIAWGSPTLHRAAGRRRRRRQGRAPPRRAPARRRRRGRDHRRLRAGRRAGPQPPPARSRWSRTPRTLVASDIDVYAPCALGDAINDETVQILKARIVCGAANNQLAHPGIEDVLESRGILYAPDYCVNAGGLVQVADELEGFSFDRAKARASTIYDTTSASSRSPPPRAYPRRRRRPDRRAPDGRRRPAAPDLAAAR